MSVKNFKSCATLNKAYFVGIMENIDSSNPENGVGFVRKGIVGDWVNYFMEEMSARFLEQDNAQDKFPIAQCTWTTINTPTFYYFLLAGYHV